MTDNKRPRGRPPVEEPMQKFDARVRPSSLKRYKKISTDYDIGYTTLVRLVFESVTDEYVEQKAAEEAERKAARNNKTNTEGRN